MSFFKDGQGTSGWGGFLKQAINNMETQLDKVLDFPEEDKTKPNLPQQKVLKPIPMAKSQSTVSNIIDPLGAGNLALDKEKEKGTIPNKSPSPSSLKEEIMSKDETLNKKTKKSTIKKTEKSDNKTNIERDNSKKDDKIIKITSEDGLKDKEDKIIKNEIQDLNSKSKIEPKKESKNEDDIDYKAIAEQRETQLINAIQSTSALNETISALQFTIEKMEKEKGDLEKRWMTRINSLENKLAKGAEEVDGSLPDDTNKLKTLVSSLKAQVEGKDEQISGLMNEGEVLTKKELKMSTILQKLRNKENENERVLAECQKRLGQFVKENSDLKARVSGLVTSEKKANDILRALKQSNDQIRREKDELETKIKKLTDNEIGLKVSLEKTQNELKNAKKDVKKALDENLKAQKEKETKDKIVLVDEAMALKLQMEENEKETQVTIQDLRQQLLRAQDQLAVREEEHQAEIIAIKSQINGTSNNINLENETEKYKKEDIDGVIEAATQPLLHQIDYLYSEISTLKLELKEFEKSSKAVIEHNSELASKLELSERALDEKLHLEDKAAKDQELSQVAIIEELEKLKEDHKISITKKEMFEAKIDKLQSTITFLKHSHLIEMEQLRKLYEFKNPAIMSSRSNSVSPSPPVSQNGDNHSRMSNNELNDSLSSIISPYQYQNRTRQSSVLPDINVKSPSVSRNRSARSSIDARGDSNSISPNSNSISGLNNLSSDNKVRALQVQLKAALESRDQLSLELVQISSKLKDFESNSLRLTNLEDEHQELLKKHEIVLELLGEKSEQLEDVKTNLEEAKFEYKKQITELISKVQL